MLFGCVVYSFALAALAALALSFALAALALSFALADPALSFALAALALSFALGFYINSTIYYT